MITESPVHPTAKGPDVRDLLAQALAALQAQNLLLAQLLAQGQSQADLAAKLVAGLTPYQGGK
jgi:hypothetical protein